MTDKINIDELRADMDEGTPGPWNWEVSVASKRVELCGGKGASDLTVMSFVRWGLQSAAPKFWFWNGSVSDEPKRADQCATPAPGREHHKSWFQRIDHPDARRIARLPALEQAYLDAIARAESAESTRDETKAFFEEYRAFASRLLDEKCTLIARAEAAEAELDRMQSLRLEGPPSDMHWLAEDPEQPLFDAIARAEAAEAKLDKLRVLLRSALERDVSGKIRRQMRLDLAALKGSDE